MFAQILEISLLCLGIVLLVVGYRRHHRNLMLAAALVLMSFARCRILAAASSTATSSPTRARCQWCTPRTDRHLALHHLAALAAPFFGSART